MYMYIYTYVHDCLDPSQTRVYDIIRYVYTSLRLKIVDCRRQVARLVVGGLWWSLLVVGNHETVLSRREVFEHVQKSGYDRRGLWWSCVIFNRSETDVQPSYDGRRWSCHWSLILLVPRIVHWSQTSSTNIVPWSESGRRHSRKLR